MIGQESQHTEIKWICHQCDLPLTIGSVTVEYLGSRFTTDLPQCPGCGRVFITEEVALGKMAEVEKILEDK